MSPDNVLYSIFTLFGFVLAIVFLKIFPNVPYVELDTEVNIISLLSLIITTIFAVGIPFLIKKLIDDNRNIKSFLADEIVNLIQLLNGIKVTFTECYTKDRITPADKDCINYAFDNIELQITSIEEQMKISFKKKGAAIVNDLKDKYFSYNSHVTGGSLMNSKFIKVDDVFRREHDLALNKFVTDLKNMVHKIHKF